jgi:hypothetical protein
MRTLFILSLFVSACGPNVENPSGDCIVNGDGNRPGYFSDPQESTYLPDCQNDLDRELWRVFAVSEESAYIVPRPDTTGLDFDLCDGEDVQLASLFETYGLCEEYGDPDIINDIPPADALSITNALHQRLRFEVDEDGMISPWAPESDILDACELTDASAALEYCEQLESRCNDSGDCDDIAYIPSAAAVEALVPALNELYGIE